MLSTLLQGNVLFKYTFILRFTRVIYMYTLDRIEKGIPLKFQYDCNSANTNGVTYCIHSVIYNMYLFCY